MFRFIKDKFYNLKYGIENLIYWFKIIWNDRSWDSYFIFKILHHKLSQMEKDFRQYGCHVGATKDAHRMKICVNLLGRLMKDDYWNLAGGYIHDRVWGDIELSYKPYEKDNNLEEVIAKRPNVVTEEDHTTERNQSRYLWERENYLQKQDVEYLFKIMNKYILGWWD